MKIPLLILLVIISSLTNVYSGGTFEIRIGKTEPVEGWDKVRHEGMDIWISPNPEITSDMISSAEYNWSMPDLSKEEIAQIKKIDPDVRISQNATKRHIKIIVTYTEQGAKKQSIVTDENSGSLMVFMFDGEILTAPKIMEKIPGDIAVITGNFTEEKAKKITKALNHK
ncbi:hypothetical protein P3T73_07345 [Kiritimatiellota bacterium B12222]|nr:hypothetical protein P3T73_07345 [Kiritimatiellota bacterium B12222]